VTQGYDTLRRVQALRVGPQALDATPPEARAVATTVRAAEEADRQQSSRMINEQLAQAQTIESLHRQVEASNTAARDSQALLRANQDQQQQSRMLPSPNYPIGSSSSSNTPFVRPFSTPSNYYHVGSPADDEYVE